MYKRVILPNAGMRVVLLVLVFSDGSEQKSFGLVGQRDEYHLLMLFPGLKLRFEEPVGLERPNGHGGSMLLGGAIAEIKRGDQGSELHFKDGVIKVDELTAGQVVQIISPNRL